MYMRRIAFGVVFIGALAMVTGAEAQSRLPACDGSCLEHTCPAGEKQGVLVDRTYDFNCAVNCNSCPERLIADDLQATEILRIISSSSPEELPAIVKKHRDRLVQHSARRLVAVVDKGCGQESVESVLFVSSAKARVLDQLGVKRFTDFVSDSATDG